MEVDDVVDGGEDGVVEGGPGLDPGEGGLPHLRVEARGEGEVVSRQARADPFRGFDAGEGVLLERGAQVRAVGLLEQVGAQVGRADRVGLRDDEVLALQEPRAGGGEAEA